ncbi:MAG: polymer-forming cytoskeletal protein [Bacteroidota bacterium]
MKTTASSSTTSSASHALNSLVQGTKVEGNIESDNDIRVDGAIKGTLKCKAKVIIGPKGLIEGEIYAQNAVVEGRFEGTLMITEVLHIKEQARVTGEISASKLVVQPGAVINGSFDMGGEKAKKLNGSNNALRAGKEQAKLANPVGK